MMYFFVFSPPSSVLAVNPARAAISTNWTLGGVAEKPWGAVVALGQITEETASRRHPNMNAATDKCDAFMADIFVDTSLVLQLCPPAPIIEQVPSFAESSRVASESPVLPYLP